MPPLAAGDRRGLGLALLLPLCIPPPDCISAEESLLLSLLPQDERGDMGGEGTSDAAKGPDDNMSPAAKWPEEARREVIPVASGDRNAAAAALCSCCCRDC